MEYAKGLDAVRHLNGRASCRNFTGEEISPEQLDAILEATLHAASGGNLQPWSVIVERDRDRNRQLAELNGGQAFIAQAPVNLVFLMDWNKYSVYCDQKDAPFVAYKSFDHFLIALEDVMCAAQTAETAAHMLGLGSCYVGTCLSCGKELAGMYGLPPKTYPMVILSLGHPAKELTPMPKLRREMMVFEGKYPSLSPEAVYAAYEEKYRGRTMPLPKTEPHRAEMLARFTAALETTYDDTKVREIVAKADAEGSVNETQRRFGLHYHAAQMLEIGTEILEMMEAQDIRPFDAMEGRK